MTGYCKLARLEKRFCLASRASCVVIAHHTYVFRTSRGDWLFSLPLERLCAPGGGRRMFDGPIASFTYCLRYTRMLC